MSKRSKSADLRRHAKQRAYLRYGFVANNHDLDAIVKSIQAGAATFVERQSNRVTVWDLEVGGQTARVVYDSLRHQIVTFLPRENLYVQVEGKKATDSL